MKVARISVYAVDAPTKGGGYRRTTGFSPAINRTTIVKLDTDEGVSGLGEVCPIGTHYMAGFGEAVRAGIPLLAPHVLGQDPFHVERLNRLWDVKFKDDLAVKTAVDVALWDIMGQATGRPVSDLLGGTYPAPVPLYRSVHLFEAHEDTPATWAARCRDYRAEGYRQFQLKTGSDPDTDIARIEAVCDKVAPGEIVLADANAGWTLHGALRVANAVKDLPVILEQPCASLEECVELRRHTSLPVKLDELMISTHDLLRAFQGGAMDIVAIKIGRVGGLTKARRMRDLAVDLGLTVVPDDVWGSEIVSSALAHFAQSTPPKHCLGTTDLTDYVEVSTAEGFPGRDGGVLTASKAPGLGLTPKMEVLGEPVAVIE